MFQQQFYRALQTCLLGMTIMITVFVSFLTTSLPTHANTYDPSAQSISLSSRHPDAGIWVVYRGSNTVEDLQKPYIKGAMAYAAWKNLYTGPNEFNWSALDAELDFIINKAGKKAMIVVTAGYCPSLEWPAWIGDRVAAKKAKHSMGCHPFQFWDPVYIDLHKAYISAFASHLAEFDANDARPNETDITFVRAQVMAETMENLSNDNELSEWEWRDFNAAKNGRVYQVDLTKSIKYAYQEEVTLTYQKELARAYTEAGLTPPAAAAKGGSFWSEYPTRDRFVDEGVWFDQHSGSPNPQGWYYDLFKKVKSGETRGTTEAGGKSPENLLAQYAYWEVLAALHYGVEFIGIYGNNKFSPDLQPKGAVSYAENWEALEFGERYAGHYRNPAASPGAWIALRGGYPEDRFSDSVYASRMWTNYEHLMTQYRPQDSVLLFSDAHPDHGQERIAPVVRRSSKQPWADEITICKQEFSAQMCEYLEQQPDQYLKQANGKHEYTYRSSDLGRVVYCGTEMFCTNPADSTRTESILWARRTNGDGGAPSMRFDLDDTFAQSLGGRVQIRVVYLDQGNGKWELRYDSRSAAEKSAVVVQKGNSNQWKEIVVDLQDVAFTNRQEGGTDLSLFNMGDDDDTFHLIEVIRTGGVNPPESQEPSDQAPSYDRSLYLPNLQR